MTQQLIRPRYFLAVGIIFFLGCQTEEIPISESRQKHLRQVTKVSFSTFKKQTGLADFKTTFALPENSNALVARRSSDSYTPEDFIVDTEQITQTVANGKISYSFPITPKQGEKEDSRFYLIVYDKAGSWLDMVIESDVSTDAIGNINENGYREIYASAARGMGCTTILHGSFDATGEANALKASVTSALSASEQTAIRFVAEKIKKIITMTDGPNRDSLAVEVALLIQTQDLKKTKRSLPCQLFSIIRRIART